MIYNNNGNFVNLEMVLKYMKIHKLLKKIYLLYII